ncbi:MAG: FHA domain-containing protein [Pyrinomonadaceae bacterium]
MTELWLKYKDGNGSDKRVAVDRDVFTIGRHSESTLCIADSRLSREHLRIESDGEDFVVSDSGSSNGTKVNDKDLLEAAVLRKGDVLNLGGVEITVDNSTDDADVTTVLEAEALPADAASAPSAAVSPAPAGGSSIPVSFFIIAPVLGIIVLVMVGGLIFLFSRGDRPTDVADGDDEFVYSTTEDKDDPKKPADDDEPVKKSPTPSMPGTPVISGPSSELPIAVSGQPPAGQNLTDTGKVEQNGAAFLRKIAQNDPKAFLTGEQAARVNTKLKNLGKSTLADNINSARKNSAQIKSLAAAKNMKPQFLAVAAITKLGNSRGDVAQTAAGIAEVYDKLGTHIGNEFAEDSLLMVAAYDQGAAGDTMKLRNMLQDLANKTQESTRTIRTIWFLEKNNKITSAEFDRALIFLAIGTITQNPKEFGVNAEALNL